MIVLKINKPKNRSEYPVWSTEMDHLLTVSLAYDPERVYWEVAEEQYIYDLDLEHGFLTPTDESKSYFWALNTKWLEVVSTDGEDLSDPESVGIKISEVFKVGAIGPIKLSTLGTYHDSTKD